MRIAITGATGFVGRNLVSELAARGHAIQVLSRGPTSIVEFSSNTESFNCDLTEDPAGLFDRIGKPDVLVHLAWGGLPNYRSTHHFENELPMHFNFLKRVIEAGVGKLLVAGTCFEYGNVSGCVDEDTTTNPTNPYGYAKDALRRQLEFLSSSHDFKLTWARIFYLYGRGQSPLSLIPLLDAAIARGDSSFPMTLGEQLRDYISVADAASIIASLAGNERGDGIVNVCSGVPVSVRRFVEDRVSAINSEIRLDMGAVAYSEIEPFAFWGDRSKLNRVLTA